MSDNETVKKAVQELLDLARQSHATVGDMIDKGGREDNMGVSDLKLALIITHVQNGLVMDVLEHLLNQSK